MSTSNLKNADSILSVTLRKNQFSAEENSFIGRVTRNTVTLENLIASISEKNAGVSPYMIQHMANLLGDEMLSAYQNAKAVDVLGLGTLYISVAGSVSGENPGESSIPGFKLNFTPSSRAQETVDSLKVDKVIIADSSPVIDIIINTFNQNEEHNLIKGKGVKNSGSKLKLLDDDAGIWFALLYTEGNVNKDETTWVQVSKTVTVILCTMLAPAASSSAAVAVRVAAASDVVIDAVSVDIAGAKNGTKKRIIVAHFS